MRAATLTEIAKAIGADINGEGSVAISAVSSIDQAQPGELTFITNAKYSSQLAACQATALIASPKTDVSEYSGTVLLHPNPYFAYAKTMQFLYPDDVGTGDIHPSASVADGVEIGSHVSIGAQVVIERGTVIGDNVVISAGTVVGEHCDIANDVRLMANVTLYHGVKIGERTRIHSGAVIGADGFGYAPENKIWHKIPQVGSVVIGSDTEIGANTTVDRGALNDTIIGNGVILDNQIQVGHNVIIGDHSAMAGASIVAGSTVIGQYCQIGGGACIGGHIELVDNVIITGMSMVVGSIKEAGVYSSGVPVTDNKRWRRNAVRFTQLDEMARNVRDLQKHIQT
ncbi:MAG: UDP-3-O-(3-hydroxymyristoyl)glucosamine N-acyltransferase [Leucothrix sp.]